MLLPFFPCPLGTGRMCQSSFRQNRHVDKCTPLLLAAEHGIWTERYVLPTRCSSKGPRNPREPRVGPDKEGSQATGWLFPVSTAHVPRGLAACGSEAWPCGNSDMGCYSRYHPRPRKDFDHDTCSQIARVICNVTLKQTSVLQLLVPIRHLREIQRCGSGGLLA